MKTSVLLILLFSHLAQAAESISCEGILGSDTPAPVTEKVAEADKATVVKDKATLDQEWADKSLAELKADFKNKRIQLDHVEKILAEVEGHFKDRGIEKSITESTLIEFRDYLRKTYIEQELAGKSPEQRKAYFRKMRIDEANKKLEVLKAKLEQVKERIKSELIGKDDRIDMMANAIYSKLKKQANMLPLGPPIVIVDLGYSGVGKTDLVVKFAEYFGVDLIRETVEENADYIPLNKLFQRGRKVEKLDSEDPGEIHVGLDFMAMLDELQKMNPYDKRKAIIARVNEPRVIKTDEHRDYTREYLDRETVRLMLESEKRLWEILGDGNAAETIANPKEYLDTIAGSIHDFKTSKELADAAAASLKTKQEEFGKGNITIDEFKKYQDAFTKANGEAFKAMRSIENGVENIVQLCSVSLGKYALLDVEALAQIVIEDFSTFSGTLKRNYAASSKITTMRNFGGGIIVLAANPQKAIAANLAKASDGSGRVDPDLLIRVTMDTPPAAMEDFFHSIFGSEQPGWKTRLNFNQWKMQPPLSETAWKMLVKDSIGSELKIVSAQIRTIAPDLNIEFMIDGDLINLLYETEVTVRGGGRESKALLDTVLSAISFQLPSALARVREKLLTDNPNGRIKLKFTLNSADTSLDITDLNNQHSASLVTRIKLLTTVKPQIPNSPISMQRTQLAMYQTARIITGSVFFKSLPRGQVDALTTTAGDALDAFWNKPDVPTLQYMKTRLVVAASGYIMEKMMNEGSLFPSGVLHTKYAEADHALIERAMEDFELLLENQKRFEERRKKPGEPVSINDIGIGFLAADPVIRALFDHDRTRAYTLIDRQVRNILYSQPILTKAILSSLIQKPYLTPDDIKNIFNDFANQRPVVKQGFWKSLMGSGQKKSTNDIDLNSLLSARPGYISNPMLFYAIGPDRPEPKKGLFRSIFDFFSTDKDKDKDKK